MFSAFSSEKQSSLLLSADTMSHRQCIEPCDRFITAGDTHERCVLCLGRSHAQAAFSGLSNCLHCDSLRLKVWHSWSFLKAQLLWDPMQENQERFLLTPPMLPVLADASSFPQSDVLTLVFRQQPNTKRLKPLADFWPHGNAYPTSRSGYYVCTIRHGYTIQFRIEPPPFSGIFPTTVRPGQAIVLRQEIVSLLEKGAIEELPPTRRKSGFYSRYFAVPKIDCGLHPILDLRLWDKVVCHRSIGVNLIQFNSRLFVKRFSRYNR